MDFIVYSPINSSIDITDYLFIIFSNIILDINYDQRFIIYGLHLANHIFINDNSL